MFGHEAVSVEHDDNVFRVRTNCMTATIMAGNIVVGAGTQLSGRQSYVAEFMAKATSLVGQRVGVVGNAQSGTEAFPDLVTRPATDLPWRLVWISRRPNYCQLTVGRHSQPQKPPTRT